MPADELDVLLVEDNPGDARLIEEMIRDAEDLLARVDIGGTAATGIGVEHEQRLSDGLERLSGADGEDAVDVVLLDLGLPDSTGLDTLGAVVEATEFVPIVVLTGLRDEQLGIEAIQHGAQDYLVKDEVTGDLLVRSMHHAIERNRQERDRARRREQLEALNRLNRISQDVTHAVITTSTRDDLERAVCDRLVEPDAYRFAWIGEVDRASGEVTPRVMAGAEEGYLDEVTVTADDAETAQGPAGQAIDTHEVQITQDVETDSEFAPWREAALERGYRSSAAVPIVHEGLLYGVLNIYASSPNDFSPSEVEILTRLGDVIGHALAAIERRDALVGDTVVELEFQLEGAFEELATLSADGEGRIAIENLVPSDDTLIAYGRTDGIPREDLQDATARADAVDDFRVLSSEGDGHEFELVTAAASSLVEAVAAHGGHVESATVEEGEFRFIVEFPPGRDKRKLVALVDEHCEGATLLAQRTTQRTGRESASSRSVLEDRLTERQRTVLETAYFGGFFDWPRASTGQELADRLGITPSTFTQHLRTAERKFFDAVFDGQDGDVGR